jgi:polysaccharide pyruvyl transferase WcaK-like protein
MVYLLWGLSKTLGYILLPIKKLFFKRKGRPKCVLITYSGANNTGAEARTIEAIQQIRNASGDSYDYYFTTINKANSLRYFSESDAFKIIEVHHIFFLFNLIPLYLRSDLVVLVEGSGFRQNFSSTLLWFFLSTLTLAQTLKIRTIAYAVDAGKLTKSNMIISRSVIDKLSLVMTRTKQAAEVIKSWGVKNSIIVNTDTAFSYKDEGQSFFYELLLSHNLDPNKPTVAIAFKDFFYFPVDINLIKFFKRDKKYKFSSIYYHNWNDSIEKKSTDFKRMVANFINEIQAEYDYNVILIAMEGMDEEPTTGINSFTNKHIPIFSSNQYDAQQISSILRNIQYLITTRYHALVLSMPAGIPTIAISHDERLESLMEELNLKKELYFEYDKYDSQELKSHLKGAFKYLHSNKDHIVGRLNIELINYVSLANNNEYEFKKFLKNNP